MLRGIFEHAPGRPVFAQTWAGIGAIRIATEPLELPEGRLLNHVLTLNLGAELACETNFDGGGWQTHRTPPEAVGLWPAGVPYAARAAEPGEHLLLEIDPVFVGRTLGPDLGSTELQPVIGSADAFAKHVMLALAEEARKGAPAGQLLAESLTTALVAHLVERERRVAPAPEPISLASPKLRRVLDYVGAHLDAPLTLQRLAELVEMDVFRFIREFKHTTGHSPHRYILEARIARAKDLLRNRALSITDVALQTGFATPSHFSVTFRRIANVTPREYRNALP